MGTFSPIDDQVLILRDPPETVTTGGLHLPDRDVSKPMRGMVLAVGPGPKPRTADAGRVPCSVSPGDVVLFGRYVGHEVAFDDRDCLVVRETELLGVLEADAPDPPGGVCAPAGMDECAACGEPAELAFYSEDGTPRGVCSAAPCIAAVVPVIGAEARGTSEAG